MRCWQPSCAHHTRGRAGCRVPGSSGGCRKARKASSCWSAGLRASGSRACSPTGRAATGDRWRGCRSTQATTTRCGSGATSPPRWTGVRPGVAERVGPIVPGTAATPFAGAVTALVNEFAATADEVALVIDDYHVVESPDVHRSVEFLLDHLPSALRLVLASRSDPPLPLARLRARGQLAELRAGDLRFTHGEAARAAAHGSRLASARRRRRGARRAHRGLGRWACTWRRCRCRAAGDVTRFVAEFSGSHRFVLDYLTEEVLDRQPAELRTFLLETSVLDRLSGPLCDAVLGRPDSQQLLESVERASLFLHPARRGAPLVALPPPVRRPAARQPAGPVPGPGARAAPRRGHLVRASTASPTTPSGTRWPRATPARAARLVEEHLEEQVWRRATRAPPSPRGSPRSRPRRSPPAAADARAGRRRADGGRLDEVEPLLAVAERALDQTPAEAYRRRSNAGSACWPTSRRASRSAAPIWPGCAATPWREQELRACRARPVTEQDELLSAVARYHVSFDRLARRTGGGRGAWAGRGLRRAARLRAARLCSGPRSTSAPSNRPAGGWARHSAPTSRARRWATCRTVASACRTSGWPMVHFERDELAAAAQAVTVGLEHCRRLAYLPCPDRNAHHARAAPAGRGRPGRRSRGRGGGRTGDAPDVRDPRLPLPALRAYFAVLHGDLVEAARWVRANGLAEDDEPVYLARTRVPRARPPPDRRAEPGGGARGAGALAGARSRTEPRRERLAAPRAGGAGARRRGRPHRRAARARRGARAGRAGGLRARVPRRGPDRPRRCCAS